MAVQLDSWKKYEPSMDSRWGLRQVLHLHRRAAFGGTAGEILRHLEVGPDEAISEMLKGYPADSFSDFEASSNILKSSAFTTERMQAWWVFRMLYSPHPLVERLTLLWHQHFATSIRKVRISLLMLEQNEILRLHALGCFGEMLHSVVKHPAMLIWLDADKNLPKHPNENLARELMELFTLGEKNYTESDVKNIAKALTGWTHRDNVFANDSTLHDDSMKTILGQMNRFDGDQVLDLLIQHKSTSRRIAWRLCQQFFSEGAIDDNAISELAYGLRARNLDISWAVETILRSRIFYDDRNIGNQIRDPAVWLIGHVRSLELHHLPCSTLKLAEAIGKTGQELFNPPTVFGWKGGDHWLTDNLLLKRIEALETLIKTSLCIPPNEINLDRLTNRPYFKVDSQLLPQMLLGSNLSETDSEKFDFETTNWPDLLQQIFKQPEMHLG